MTYKIERNPSLKGFWDTLVLINGRWEVISSTRGSKRDAEQAYHRMVARQMIESKEEERAAV